MKTRFRCPMCQDASKTFTRYIDTLTGEYIHDDVGKCSRENKCGYHMTPKQYFQNNGISFDATHSNSIALKADVKPVSYIPKDELIKSFKDYDTNKFIIFLKSKFNEDQVNDLIKKYLIGTSDIWHGSTVFWQIDIKGRIRTGKIMLYNEETGKRVKQPKDHVNWVHSTLKQSDFELKQCFFGEHLLTDKLKAVAIVESEKTALIASIFFPKFIWLACGNINGLNEEKCNVLKGRNVMLFPDLKAFDKWSQLAKEFSHITVFKVSDLLEKNATDAERGQGLDIADYLLKHTPTEQQVYKETKTEVEPTQATTWDTEIKDLETYFSNITIPLSPLKLYHNSIITDIPIFIESHINTVKTHNGNETFKPYLIRLNDLKNILEHGKAS